MAQMLVSEGEISSFMQACPVSLLYFSGDDCSVCHALYPKVEAMLEELFPRAALGRVNCSEHPELAAQHNVFAVPTIVVVVDGRESQRLSRSFGLGQLREALERPYQILFDNG